MGHYASLKQIYQTPLNVYYFSQEICGIIHMSYMSKVSTFRPWFGNIMSNHANELQKDTI